MTDETETTTGGTVRPKRAELVQAAIDAKIPAHRQAEKTSDTVKGLLVIFAGILLLTGLLVLRAYLVPTMPLWILGVPVVIMIFGGFSTDDEWISLKAKKFLATVGDFADAVLSRIRGTPPTPPPATS